MSRQTINTPQEAREHASAGGSLDIRTTAILLEESTYAVRGLIADGTLAHYRVGPKLIRIPGASALALLGEVVA